MQSSIAAVGGVDVDALPQAQVFCKLCLSELPLTESSQLHSCGCVFCTPCLQRYVLLAIQEGAGAPITCPDAACVGTDALLDSEIARFAPVDLVQLYQKLQFERDVHLDHSRTWCPMRWCQAMCPVVPDPAGGPVPVSCPACPTVFCSSCSEDWHPGHSCSELQPLVLPRSENSVSGEMAHATIKPCPACGVYIERDQGCAQMLCKRCKHTFCWYCMQNLDGDIFLRHYDKGPCKNKLGHSRASVIWNRTQVVGVLLGIGLLTLVMSPLLLLASPCVLGYTCLQCQGEKKRRNKKKEQLKDENGPE